MADRKENKTMVNLFIIGFVSGIVFYIIINECKKKIHGSVSNEIINYYKEVK